MSKYFNIEKGVAFHSRKNRRGTIERAQAF
jgi:hypothetical protein